MGKAALQYLHFDSTDNASDGVSFEAMAVVNPPHWPALQAEIASVLDWAEHRYPGVRGPIEEDGDWDFDLQASLERRQTLRLEHLPARQGLQVHPEAGTWERYHVTLTLSGTPGFAAALRAAFAGLGD